VKLLPFVQLMVSYNALINMLSVNLLANRSDIKQTDLERTL